MNIAVFILITCMVFPYVGAVSFAADTDTVYFYEDFNYYSTNETETKLKTENTTPYVKDISKNNKGILVETGISKTILSASWENKSNETVIAFNVKESVESSGVDISVLSSSGGENKIIYIGSDGVLYAYDGKKLGGIGMDRIRTVSVVIDSFENIFSVYIDRRCVLSDWRLPAIDIYPQGLKFAFNSGAEGTAEVYLDEIRAYSGRNIYKTFQETPYNDTVTEIIEVPDKIGAAIIASNDFEIEEGDAVGRIGQLSLNNKENPCEIVAEDDNHYLRMNHNNSNDMHIDVNFTNELNFLVLQYDCRFEQFGCTIYPSILRDNVSSVSSIDDSIGGIDANGNFTLSNGVTVETLQINKWYRFAFAYNIPNRTINVYIDNELVYENLPIRAQGLLVPQMSRIWILGTVPTIMQVDNYALYEAKEPMSDISDMEDVWVSVFSDGSREETMLSGKTAMCTANGLIYKDGVKEITGEPEVIDGDYYVTRQTAEKLLGTLGGNYGDSVPLKAAAEEKGLFVYENDSKYLLIFSEKPFKADDDLISDVSSYMKMILPSAEMIEADFSKKDLAHPRIIATAEDFENIKKNIEEDEEVAGWHDKLMASAESKLLQEVSYYHYGLQDNILDVARAFKEKMFYFGYAWQITGDRKYVDAAWKEFEAVCNFPDWDPTHAIDTGEMLLGAAIGYDWMYDAFTDEQRKVIEEGTLNLGIEVIRSAYYGRLQTDSRFGALSGGSFATGTTNFNGVVNGGEVAAALAFADVYPEQCFDAVSQAIRSVACMLPGFEPDGGWTEGPNYWDYVTMYLSYMVGALETSCGTDYGILEHPGVRQTPYYAVYLDSFQGVNNFSDTAQGMTMNSTQFSFFGKYFDDPGLAYQRYIGLRDKNQQPSVFDMIWYDASAKNEKPELPLDRRVTGVEMVSMREDWDRSDSMNFGVHGGQNNVYHGHYDGGSFIFDLLGERWAVDLGMDMQSYVGVLGYKLYRFRAEGHNMLVFNPGDGNNEDFNLVSTTSVLRYETAPKGGIVVYDNSEGYSPWTTSVIRGFYIGDERRSMTVRDEFTVKKDDTVVYWNMQTPADIEINGTTAILTINGKKLQAEFSSDCDNLELIATQAVPFETSPTAEGMVDDSGTNKLMAKLTTSGSAYIEVKLSALGEPASQSGMINKPISEWTLPEGELIRRGDSNLKSISLDGIEMASFNPNVTTYTLPVLEGEELPVITAESDNGNVEIDQAENVDDVTTITSYDDNKYYKTVYVIKYKLLHPPEDLFGMTRLTVYDLQVSSTPEEENVGPNMLDGDLSTRWASEGSGENAVFDLGSVQTIDAFAIAYEWGDERNYSFDVEISEDGNLYTPLWSGSSCGYTEDYELIELENPVSARYVKLIGRGNTVNAWNGVREFALLQKK